MNWDEYGMSIAKVVAKKSKDPWLTDKYEDFNVWLFSQELICVTFRKGRAASNNYRNR